MKTMNAGWCLLTMNVICGLTAGSFAQTSRVSAATLATTYTWNQTGTAAWTTSTNWTPTRTTPATDDILVFDNGATTTVTGVPAQTIGQLLVSSSTKVSLQAGASNTLTIGGGSGTDLSIAGGSELNMTGANPLTLLVDTGATGSYSGNMTCSGAASKLNASDANAITFNSGAILTQDTGCTGNIFTAAGTANAVVFASGSIFVSKAGANPFGLSNPNSKVIFQSGSLFRMEQNSAPSFVGRTYANFEVNHATFSQSATGSTAALTMDSLTITDGTLNLNLTGGISIKGNIAVASGETLTFSPASANTLSLNGTSEQLISGGGTLTFAANTTVSVSNAAGVKLSRNVTISGPLTVDSGGLFDANGNSVTVSGTLTNNGTLKQTLAVNGTGTVDFFNTGSYGGAVLDAAGGGDLGSTTVTIRGNRDCSAGMNTIKRCYAIEATNGTGRIATVKLAYYTTPANEENGLTCGTLEMYRWDGGAWLAAGNTPTYSCGGTTRTVQKVGVTSFSPFVLAGPAGPTAVNLVSFVGRSSGDPFHPLGIPALGILYGLAMIRIQRRRRAGWR